MQWIFLFLFSYAESGSDLVVNQILFSESKQSWTARDLDLFVKIKKQALPAERLSQFTENDDEDFLLSRLSAREAILFEVAPTKIKLSEQQRQSLTGFSNQEIEAELKEIALAAGLVELKESQLQQRLRFKTWFDLLKRKYQVKIKSFDFKP